MRKSVNADLYNKIKQSITDETSEEDRINTLTEIIEYCARNKGLIMKKNVLQTTDEEFVKIGVYNAILNIVEYDYLSKCNS